MEGGEGRCGQAISKGMPFTKANYYLNIPKHPGMAAYTAKKKKKSNIYLHIKYI